MRKYILVLIIATAAVLPVLALRSKPAVKKQELVCSLDLKICQENLLKYLRLRKDNLAQAEIKKILSVQQDDVCALWAKAEILRRAYKFEDAEKILNRLLVDCPGHAPSLISLAYIRYHDYNFPKAMKLLKEVLRKPGLGQEDKAMAYMLMGSINAKRALLGGLFSKFAYGMRIKGYFEKAKAIAPDLPEVHLGLGTFCLLAPKIAGGDVNRAIEELECAIKLAPDFATPWARLAQAYRIKGDAGKYDFYLKKARELDPENEVVKEIETPL